MPVPWVDAATLQAKLASFFEERRDEVQKFGSTVNQIFEAHVLASTAARYRASGWNVKLVHPELDGAKAFRLKFSTRGAPAGYSYFECASRDEKIQIRHQLRVATRHYTAGDHPRSNICLDVAVVKPFDASAMVSDDAVPNDLLVTFGEAKHMSAFAELVAGFVGVVHELQPERLSAAKGTDPHPSPFLYVSGYLNGTAAGLVNTIKARGLDIQVFSQNEPLAASMPLPTVPAPAKFKARRKKTRTGTTRQGP